MKSWLRKRAAEEAEESGTHHDDGFANLLMAGLPPEKDVVDSASAPTAKIPIAVAVVVLAPKNRTVLVRDPSKRDPLWKCPGGKGEGGNETPEEAAARELFEETGLSATANAFRIIHTEEKAYPARHDHYFLLLDISDQPELPVLAERGQEGEEVAYFTQAQVLGMMGELLPTHRIIIKKFFLEA